MMDSASPAQTYLKRRSVIKREDRVVKIGAEAGEAGAKQLMLRKAEMVKELIKKCTDPLIIVENVPSREVMNEILPRVIEVAAVALSRSQDADPTHILTRYSACVSVLTNVLEFDMERADDFTRQLVAIKNGRHEDENKNILVLYELTEGRRDLASNYVAFVVGKDVDAAVKIIESVLGPPAATFSAPIDDAPSTYVVLMLPLTLQDLENGPIEMPREYIEEIKNTLYQPSEVQKDG